jgi:glyoxalase family protein
MMEITGIHHVTAITGDTSYNVAFYTQVLGLRLVKKTVNHDDVSAYHLFYSDGAGTPGMDMTFFDWPMAIRNRPGTGTTTTTAFRVPSRAAIDYWAQRLEQYGIVHSGIIDRYGRAAITFADAEGQGLALVDDGGIPFGTPWEQSPVPAEMQIRGFADVVLTVRELGPTAAVLTEVLGFRRVAEYPIADGSGSVTAYETGPGGPGAIVYVAVQPELPPAAGGRGGVHHVAFRTPNEEEHRAWRERIAAAGFNVTPEIDRFYFRSIYFREPGGVLFEIATDGPGFATDEDPAHLGEGLALPPFLEPYRARIEAGLHPIEPRELAPVPR